MIKRKKLCISFVLLALAVLFNAGTATSAPGQVGCDALKTYVEGLTDEAFGQPTFNITTTFKAATATIPEHCVVQGWLWPQIQFSVQLPTAWNNRHIHFGGGGWDGVLGKPSPAPATPAQVLTLGYAYDMSNGGWDNAQYPPNNGGIFGLKDPYFQEYFPEAGKGNPEACQHVVDFGIRSHRESPLIARKIIEQYYGSKPAYTYYSGSSCGGKEGMISTQKMYDIYDGFYIGCPLGGHMAVTYRGMWDTVKGADLAALVDPSCTGPACATIYSKYKAALHYKTVYDKCDGVDGLVDGLIDDPRKCKFNALTDLSACTAEQEADGSGRTSTTCFTLAQRTALADIYAGPYDSKGNPLFVGQPLGAEYVTALGSSGFGAALNDARGIPMFQFIALDPPPGPTYTGATFNWDKDTKVVQKTTCKQCYEDGKCKTYNIHNTVDGITISPNPKPNMGGLNRAKKKGAKIIQYHGWADALVSALAASANYYEGLLKSMGTDQTKSFYKLYMVPGMGHCSGGLGVNPNWIDPFGALVNWVENDVEPTSIPGARNANVDANFPLARTRPLCPYPEVARWDGTGSIEDTGSFSCVPPIEVKFSPATINLKSKGTFTASITVPKGYTMKDWALAGLTCEGAAMKSGSANGQTYRAKFNVKDLTNVPTGNSVTLTVKGQFGNSRVALVQASNAVKVINK
jgi:hypothetical protein